MLRIKELRKEKHISQKDFAKLFNLSNKSISAYENGTALPTLDTLIKMSRFFNCTIDYLVGIDPNKNLSYYDNNITDYLDLFNNLNLEKQQVIKNIIVLFSKDN